MLLSLLFTPAGRFFRIEGGVVTMLIHINWRVIRLHVWFKKLRIKIKCDIKEVDNSVVDIYGDFQVKVLKNPAHFLFHFFNLSRPHGGDSKSVVAI